MRLHAVTVSVNYSDILKHTINKNLLTSHTIITCPNDTATLKLCEANKVKVLTSELYKSDGADFNKSKMINIGLRYVYNEYPNDWYLILDSDIIFTLDRKIALYPNRLYGARRRIYESRHDYENNIFSVDTHLKPYEHYSLMGYFQLYKRSNIFYDESYTNAFYCDTKFALDHFGQNNQEDLPPIHAVCDHLGPINSNWNGRKTPLW